MTVLKQYTSGSWQPIAAGVQGPAGDWSVAQPVSTQTASYEVLPTDNGKLITLSNANAIDLFVNTGLGLVAGQRIDFIQLDVGRITVKGTATVNSSLGKVTRTRYSAATLLCIGSDSYVLVGDLVLS
jgi:hypothetical protein